MLFLYDHSSIEKLNNIAFEIFGRPIYWYGILIATGALIAFFWGKHIAVKRFKIPENVVFDGFIIGLIIGVIGTRIWYVLFKLDEYMSNPIRIITEFGQGLAIHGAIVFAGIFVIFYCKKKKIHVLQVGELVASGFFVGQIFGRWGNFFNQEAHGGLVSGWPNLDAQRVWLQNRLIPDFIVNQMYISGDGTDVRPSTGYYHPTFLYESLWNMLGLAILVILRKTVKKYWIGDGISFYLVWYSIGRFFIEGLRTDSLMVGGLRTAQVTSIILIVIGIASFVLRRIYSYYPVSFRDFEKVA